MTKGIVAYIKYKITMKSIMPIIIFAMLSALFVGCKPHIKIKDVVYVEQKEEGDYKYIIHVDSLCDSIGTYMERICTDTLVSIMSREDLDQRIRDTVDWPYLIIWENGNLCNNCCDYKNSDEFLNLLILASHKSSYMLRDILWKEAIAPEWIYLYTDEQGRQHYKTKEKLISNRFSEKEKKKQVAQ